MIALLFSWVLIASVFFTFGRAFMQLWSLASKKKDLGSALDIIVIGMCVTASVIAVFSLWMPANTMLLFALGFMCITYWLVNYKSIPILANMALDFLSDQPKSHLLCYAIIIVSIGMFCTLHPTMTDTLYYHIQNIMWNEEYAIVPGLANLQPRFAFNSSYFLLASTFGLKPLFGQYILGVHTLFLVTTFVWTLHKVLNTKEFVKSTLALIILVVFFVIYKIHITSATTDFIPNLLILYLMLKVIFDKDAILKSPVLFVLLPIFIVTLKLSCFAIAILALYVLWKQMRGKEYKVLSVLIVGILLIIVPWCTRNVILSGYLIFPFPYIDIFSYDWKIPIEYAIEQKEFIQAFAKVPNELDITNILAMPITEWFPIWWKSDMFYFNPIANRIFFFLTLATIPLGAVAAIKARKDEGQTNYILFWVICLIGIIVWFLNAPDFRFIYALILGEVAFSFLLAYGVIDKDKKLVCKLNLLNIRIALTIITITFVAAYSARWVYYQKGDAAKITDIIKVSSSISYTRNLKGLHPTDEFYSVDVNGLRVYRLSRSDRDVMCFDSKLPCSADYVGGLEMRGKTLQEGFKCNPNAPRRLTY